MKSWFLLCKLEVRTRTILHRYIYILYICNYIYFVMLNGVCVCVSEYKCKRFRVCCVVRLYDTRALLLLSFQLTVYIVVCMQCRSSCVIELSLIQPG